MKSKLRKVGTPWDKMPPEIGLEQSYDSYLGNYSTVFNGIKLQLANAIDATAAHEALTMLIDIQIEYEQNLSHLLTDPWENLTNQGKDIELDVKISSWVLTSDIKTSMQQAGVWEKTGAEIVSAQRKILNFWADLEQSVEQDPLFKEAARLQKISHLHS